MDKNIYENIIKNSKIAYLKISCKKDNNDKYTGINVIEQNKEFEKFLHVITDNNILNKDISEVLINNWINNKFFIEKFDLFVRTVMRDGHSTMEYNIMLKERKVIVDAYYMEKYIIVIFNFQNDIENYLDKKSRIYNWSKDLDGVYTDAYIYYIDSNKKETIKKIIGKKDFDLWKQEDVILFRANDLEVISKRSVKTFYEILTYKNGKKVYVESTLWPLEDENKNIVGVKGASIEIDEKLAFELSMQQNEENFREITRFCESVFIIRDKLRATYVSAGYKNVFEAEPYELYKDIDKLAEYFRRIKVNTNNDIGIINFTYEEPIEGIDKVKLDSGKEKWICYKFLPIKDLNGKTTKSIGILTDITERKYLEEKRNQIKLDFFTNLSHDLRTPINLISSSVQLMKMNLNKSREIEPDLFYRYIDIIENNSFRLLKLVNNLLDSSKIDAGFINFKPVNADIIRFIEEICDSVIEFIKFNNMKLVFDTNSEEEVVLFDADIIERIILNLLSNAVKFNRPNGTIYVNLYVDEDEISIIVKDEGIGIPSDQIDTVFNRFEQVNSKEKIQNQGSGIGLYLVKTLTELHGGNITVNSIVNQGSEFIVTIPKEIIDVKEEFIIKNSESRYVKASIEFSDT